MKSISIFFIFFIYFSICKGQLEVCKRQLEDKYYYQLPNNSFNFESLGNSFILGSLNYERIIFHNNNIYFSGRLGIGFFAIYDFKLYSAPILLNCIYRIYKAISIEGGIGTTLFYRKEMNYNDNSVNPLLTGFIGLRLQHRKGFCFRAGFVPFYDFSVSDFEPSVFDRSFVPWYGFSWGYSFGKRTNIKVAQ